jgi:signal transduction histidine kinase
MDDKGLNRMLHAVDSKADLLTELINEMLDVSRIERGVLPLRLEQFDLTRLLQEVASGFKMTAPDFAIECELPGEPITINADRQRIEQVLVNLVNNAIKYSGGTRKVQLNVTDGAAGPTVLVRDPGVGIPAAQQGQVSSRFFRASNVSTPRYSGLGLGLYISHGIVMRHGGSMWDESSEGVGSTFYFTLPSDQD